MTTTDFFIAALTFNQDFCEDLSLRINSMSLAIFSAKLDMAHPDVQLVWRRINTGGLDEVDEVRLVSFLSLWKCTLTFKPI